MEAVTTAAVAAVVREAAVAAVAPTAAAVAEAPTEVAAVTANNDFFPWARSRYPAWYGPFFCPASLPGKTTIRPRVDSFARRGCISVTQTR